MRIWQTHVNCQAEADKLAAAINTSSFFASILINKGFNTVEKALDYIYPERTLEHDPLLLPDMEKAVKRIRKAITEKESIVIYGDYDADGATGTAILVRNLKAMGANVDYYNPDRFTEGYGLNVPALEILYKKGAKLIITVDCGISNIEEVAAMKGKLSFIITDHHQPSEILPPAEVIIDAHRKDSKYPYKHLCGAAVAYKLCKALWDSFNHGDKVIGLELAAIATIADVVPLTGENRRIASTGLRALEKTNLHGIRAMLEQSKLSGKKLIGEDVGYRIGPQINSAGRLEHVRKSVELLLTDNKNTADKIAAEIYELNEKRKEMGNEIIKEAEDMLAKTDISRKAVILLASDNWHQGLIGNSANKILEKYCRSTFLLSIKGEIAVGSARAVDGFDLFKALCRAEKEQAGIFINYGGHAKAAGFTIKKCDIEKFHTMMERYAHESLIASDFIHKDKITLEINPLNVNISMIEELEKLEPCGEKNLAPLFGVRNIDASDVRRVGSDGNHLQFYVGLYPDNVRGIAFFRGDMEDEIRNNPVNMTYILKINEYNGRQSVQFMVDSLDNPLSEGRKCEINVENLRKLYREIRDFQASGKYLSTAPEELFREFPFADLGMDVEFLSNGIKILEEAGLLTLTDDGMNYVLGNELKMKIEDTPHYQNSI